MKLAVAVLGLVASLALAGCGEEPKTPAPAAPTGGATSAYPLDTCVVSGEKLGSMGDPVVIQHEGIEVRFCCAKCVDDFRKAPATYMAKLKAGKTGK